MSCKSNVHPACETEARARRGPSRRAADAAAVSRPRARAPAPATTRLAPEPRLQHSPITCYSLATTALT